MRTFANFLVAFFLLSGTSLLSLGQEVPNDFYKSWSKYKVGASITMKTITKMGGRTISQIKMVQELVEKDDEKIVIEISTVVVANGMEFKAGGNKVTHKKNVKASFTKPTDIPKQLKIVETGKGKETIKIGGTSYACNWIGTKVSFKGVNTESKVWLSDKVPGQVVKTVAKTSSGIETTSVLDSFDQK